MQHKVKGLWLITLGIVSHSVWSDALQPGLTFEIIQNDLTLNTSNVKSAAIIEDNGKFEGLNIELKANFADTFKVMTQTGIGKRMDIIYNGKRVTSAVLKTALGPSIIVYGISREDAQAFIDSLKTQQNQENAVKTDQANDQHIG